MKVLIADDERITLMALGRHLQKWGYEVVKAGDGRAAILILDYAAPP